MKRVAIAAVLSACLVAPAFAEVRPVEVAVPANIADPAVAAAYKQELRDGVTRVCRAVTGDIMGHGWHVFERCKQTTLADLAAREPTGLLRASMESQTSTDIAMR